MICRYCNQDKESFCGHRCTDCERERVRVWQSKHIHERRESTKRWRNSNTDHCRKKCRDNYYSNRDDRIQYRILRRKEPRVALDHYVGCLVYRALKSKSQPDNWYDYFQYSLQTLIMRLESMFQPGMSWDNYSRYGWHLDHIIPKSKFDYKLLTDQSFSSAWSIDNLQPLWASDNLSKGSSITHA